MLLRIKFKTSLDLLSIKTLIELVHDSKQSVAIHTYICDVIK